MDFGIPMLIEMKSIKECAALCSSLGLQFVELNMNLPQYQAESMDIPLLKETAAEYGIYYTIHLDEKLNVCDFNRSVASAYTETVLKTAEIAEKLSVPVLNMHFNEGVYFTLPHKKVYLYKEYIKEYRKSLTDFRDLLTAEIGDKNISLCIENTRSFLLDFVGEGVELLLESPVFSLTFDTGHDAGSGFKQFPLIERNINRLRHMHLHDYSGEKGDHLPLGEGCLDIVKYIKLANEHNCRVLIETKTAEGVRASVDWIKNNCAYCNP